MLLWLWRPWRSVELKPEDWTNTANTNQCDKKKPWVLSNHSKHYCMNWVLQLLIVLLLQLRLPEPAPAPAPIQLQPLPPFTPPDLFIFFFFKTLPAGSEMTCSESFTLSLTITMPQWCANTHLRSARASLLAWRSLAGSIHHIKTCSDT